MREWARPEMEGATLWDRRCNESAIRIVESLAEHWEDSFSTATGQAGRQAAGNICSDGGTSPEDLLRGHVYQTAERCRSYPLVLVDQDTTSFNFSSLKASRGFGPINRDAQSLGFFLHSAFALSPDGLPLGVLAARTWVRDPAAHGQHRERRHWAVAAKESQKWLDVLADVEEALDPEIPVLLIQDRESDEYTFLAAPRRAQTQLLLRACHPRCVEVEASEPGERTRKGKLLELAGAAPVAARMTVWVPLKEKGAQAAAIKAKVREEYGERLLPAQRRKRPVVLEVRYQRIRIFAPGNWKAPEEWAPEEVRRSVEMTVIHAEEVDAPEGAEPVKWVLLTTVPIDRAEDACRMVTYYALRWRIERFHYTLKSGCRVEKLQGQEAHTIINKVALCCVAAWRLMLLTYLGRAAPETPAAEVLSDEELAVLRQKTGRRVETVREATIAIARLGGFEPHRSAGDPGLKSLWLGLARLQAMAEGYRLACAMMRLEGPAAMHSILSGL